MSITRASLLSIVLVLAGCGRSDPPATRSDSASQAPEAGVSAPKTAAGAAADTTLHGGMRHYEVNSAKLVMRSTSQVGEPMTITTMFDNHGAKESTTQDIVAEVQGKKIRIVNVTVIRDGWAVIYDPKMRVGTRSPATLGFLSNIPNFAAADRSTLAALQYRPVEPRTILGHECAGHAFVNEGVPVQVWLWQGIPLRSEIHLQSGDPIVSEATSLDLDVAIPDSVFVVPPDVKVKTVGADAAPGK